MISSEAEVLSVEQQIQTLEIQQAIRDGDDFRVVYPGESETDTRVTGCRCYMSVTGVSNLITNFTDNDHDYHSWILADANSNNNFAISGRDATYTFGGGSGSYQDLPSSFVELSSPSDGSHMFYFSSSNENAPPDNFTAHTIVNCYDQLRNGSSRLGTTTHHDFVWSEGALIYSAPFFQYVAKSKNFSCIWQRSKDRPL